MPIAENVTPDKLVSYAALIKSMATELWFIRTVGVTAASYGIRMFYKAYLYNGRKKMSDEIVSKKVKGVVPFSHLFWTLISTYMIHRNEILSRNFTRAWDLILIDFMIFLTLSIVCYSVWEYGLAPLSDRKFGTRFVSKKS